MRRPTNIIYGLVDPLVGRPRYIGKSTSGFERPYAHLNRVPLSDRTHRANWIRSLKNEGRGYFVVTLQDFPDDASDETLNDAECKWIAFGHAEGWDLTNATVGGDGQRGWHPDEITRARMSEAALLKWEDPEYRERHRLGLTGREFSDEHRHNLGSLRRGKPMHPHAAAALRVANAGRVRAQSQEERDQRSVQMTGNSYGRGYKHTAEARARISAARMGKPTHGKNYRPKKSEPQ